jgi:glycosyltransferase involved in cell wall biosynthesis
MLNQSSGAAFMAKIRVMQLIEDVGAPGGAEKVVYDLAAGLDRSRFETVIAVVQEGVLVPYYRPIGVPIEVIAGGGMRFATMWALRKAIVSHRIDLVHSHLMKMNTYNGLSSLVARCRRVASIHGLLPHEVTPTARFYGRFASIMTDRTVVVSDSLAKSVTDTYGVSPRKLVIIPNGFDSSRIDKQSDDGIIRAFREKYRLSEGVPTAVAIGNIRDVKGYEFLLRATAEVKKQIPDIRILIAGYDRLVPELGLDRLMHELHIEDSVTFLGHFPDIATLLSVANLYVCSSVHEGFSITTIEAMSFGLPVVVTDCGGPAEIVDHGKAGVLVPPGNGPALAEGMLKVLKDPVLSQRLVEVGRRRAIEEFSMSRFLKRHEDLYYGLVTK